MAEMTDAAEESLDQRCLRSFREWLAELPTEVERLCSCWERDDTPEPLRSFAARAVAHLQLSLQFSPEGVEDLMALDALFTFRALARQAVDSSPELASDGPGERLGQLRADAELVAEFLGDDFSRLCAAVPLEAARAAPSTPDSSPEPEDRARAIGAVRQWLGDYVVPTLPMGDYELAKLRAFMTAQLRRKSVA